MLNFEFPPIGGGAANATYYLLKEFAKAPDIEIDLVTTSNSIKPEIIRLSSNITIFKLKINKKNLHYWRMAEIVQWTWKAYWFSNKLIKEKEYDLCHCWFGWPAGVVGYLLKKRISYIVALRGSDVPGYNIRLKILDKIFFKFISRIIWKNAKAMTANSNNLKELARKTYNNINIRVIYNGVDTSKFRPINKRKEFNILFVGRLIKRKGLIYLLKAFKEVCKEKNSYKLTIVGSGPEEEYLIRFCEQKRMNSNVDFLKIVKHDKLVDIYQKAHILVLPSLEESLANVALEAMSTAIPIITTNTGTAELIDGNGFIVEKKNHEQIKEVITRYLDNPTLLKEHGVRSREIAEKMSWGNMAKGYVEVFDSIYSK